MGEEKGSFHTGRTWSWQRRSFSGHLGSGGPGLLGTVLFPSGKKESFAFEGPRNRVVLNHGLAPLPVPLLVPPHLMFCGLRDITKSSSWHLDKIPQICLFAAVFQMFHDLIAQAVQDIYIKGPQALERSYVLPACFCFEFCMEGDCIVKPLIVTKLMALNLEATGLNFREWDLLQTIT